MWTETDQKPVDPKRALERGGRRIAALAGFPGRRERRGRLLVVEQVGQGQMLNEAQLGVLHAADRAEALLDPVSEALVPSEPTPALEVVAAVEPILEAATEMAKAAVEMTEAMVEAAVEALPEPVAPPPVVVEPPPAPKVVGRAGALVVKPPRSAPAKVLRAEDRGQGRAAPSPPSRLRPSG